MYNIESCQLLQYQKSKAGNSSHHLKRMGEFLQCLVKALYSGRCIRDCPEQLWHYLLGNLIGRPDGYHQHWQQAAYWWARYREQAHQLGHPDLHQYRCIFRKCNLRRGNRRERVYVRLYQPAYLMPSSFAVIAMLHGNEYSSKNQIYKYGILMMILTPLVVTLIGYSIGTML